MGPVLGLYTSLFYIRVHLLILTHSLLCFGINRVSLQFSLFPYRDFVSSCFLLLSNLRRIRRRDYSLPLFSEPYLKVSLHTAQASYNPLFGQQFMVMVTVSGRQGIL